MWILALFNKGVTIFIWRESDNAHGVTFLCQTLRCNSFCVAVCFGWGVGEEGLEEV